MNKFIKKIKEGKKILIVNGLVLIIGLIAIDVIASNPKNQIGD